MRLFSLLTCVVLCWSGLPLAAQETKPKLENFAEDDAPTEARPKLKIDWSTPAPVGDRPKLKLDWGATAKKPALSYPPTEKDAGWKVRAFMAPPDLRCGACLVFAAQWQDVPGIDFVTVPHPHPSWVQQYPMYVWEDPKGNTRFVTGWPAVGGGDWLKSWMRYTGCKIP